MRRLLEILFTVFGWTMVVMAWLMVFYFNGWIRWFD